MSPTLIGYKTGNKATSISEFNQVIGSGLNIESGVVTNTGTTLNASTTGIFGGAWHGISWVAIGIVQAFFTYCMVTNEVLYPD